MFIGHEALALAAKRVAPGTSLGTLVAAATFLDLLWPIFLLLGWERVAIDPGNTAFTPLAFTSYPISHSLIAVAGWGVLFGGVCFVVGRRLRDAVVAGLLVVSHWALDFIVHRPDLPVLPGGRSYGLGLWNSVPATIAIEAALFLAGIWLCVRGSHPRDRTGFYAFWSLVLLLAIIYAGNAAAPPPPSSSAVAWVALSGWLVPFWAAWADRHRESNPRQGSRPGTL
jgi:hypothetical protein